MHFPIKERSGCHLFDRVIVKERKRSAPLSFLYCNKLTFQGGNDMSISTNGIGSNPFAHGQINTNIATVAKDIAVKNAAIQESIKENSSRAVEVASATPMTVGKKLQYNVNEKLNQVVVKVVDPATNEIVREIPSTEMQEMRIRVKDAIGNFIDETW